MKGRPEKIRTRDKVVFIWSLISEQQTVETTPQTTMCRLCSTNYTHQMCITFNFPIIAIALPLQYQCCFTFLFIRISLSFQILWSIVYRCSVCSMCRPTGERIKAIPNIRAFNLNFVWPATITITARVVKICAGRETINSAITHAHRPVALYVCPDGKAITVPNVSVSWV